MTFKVFYYLEYFFVIYTVSPCECLFLKHTHMEDLVFIYIFYFPNDAKAETPVLWSPHVKS